MSRDARVARVAEDPVSLPHIAVTHRDRVFVVTFNYYCIYITPFVLVCGKCRRGRLRPVKGDVCAVCGAVVTFIAGCNYGMPAGNYRMRGLGGGS